MPADIILYALVAAGLVFWLRNILGTRHGDERTRGNPFSEEYSARKETDSSEPSKTFTEFSEMPGSSGQEKVTQLAENPQDVISIANKTAENGLIDIAKADRSFDIEVFLDRAQDAFAFVLEAYSKGDKETLQGLLTKDVFEVFEKALDSQDPDQEEFATEILSFKKAQVLEAELKGKKASITVKFIAEESVYTKDKDGEKAANTAGSVSEITDIWVFSRDLRSNDPRWLVSETRGDFDGDNDRIPDTH